MNSSTLASQDKASCNHLTLLNRKRLRIEICKMPCRSWSLHVCKCGAGLNLGYPSVAVRSCLEIFIQTKELTLADKPRIPLIQTFVDPALNDHRIVKAGEPAYSCNQVTAMAPMMDAWWRLSVGSDRKCQRKDLCRAWDWVILVTKTKPSKRRSISWTT